MQLGFIDFICMPVYKHLAQHLPSLQPMVDNVTINRENWAGLQGRYDGFSSCSLISQSQRDQHCEDSDPSLALALDADNSEPTTPEPIQTSGLGDRRSNTLVAITKPPLTKHVHEAQQAEQAKLATFSTLVSWQLSLQSLAETNTLS